jgi:type II secretory pathway pseudopilin PulG
MQRFAFTLLELVFTILILGFILSALPTIMITDQKTRDSSIIQEAIYASTAKMSQLLSYKWDEASNEDNNTISNAKVLDINASGLGDSELDRNNSKFRVGHFNQTGGRRSFHNNPTSSPGLGSNASDLDDIDDSDINGQNLLTPSTTAGGYKDTYTLDIATTYVNDDANYSSTIINGFEFETNVANVANPTNIKRINITIKDSNGETLFNMRTYSSNIGESPVFSRIF